MVGHAFRLVSIGRFWRLCCETKVHKHLTCVYDANAVTVSHRMRLFAGAKKQWYLCYGTVVDDMSVEPSTKH